MFFYSGAKLWKHFKIPKFPKKIFYLCVIFCISCYKRIRFTEIGGRRSEGRKSEVGGRKVGLQTSYLRPHTSYLILHTLTSDNK